MSTRVGSSDFKSIYESFPQGIMIVDRESKIIAVNPAAEKLLGSSTAVLCGTVFAPPEVQFFSPAGSVLSKNIPFIRSLRSGKPSPAATYGLLRRGKNKPLWVVISVSRIQTGDPSLFIIVIQKTAAPAQPLPGAGDEESGNAHEADIRFLRAMNAIPEVFYISDIITPKILYISPAYERIWGRTVQSIYEDITTFIGAIDEELRPAVFDALHRQSVGENTEIEYQITRPDGTKRWIYDRAFPFTEGDGTIWRVTGIAEDITERKRAEVILRESQTRLELALLGAGLCSWDWNIITGTTTHNERWAEILGYSLKELGDTSVNFYKKHVFPDDLARVFGQIELHLSGAVPIYECEYRLVRKDASLVWVQDRGKVVESGRDGSPIRMAGVIMDITNQKLADVALRESEERFRVLFETMQQGVIYQKADGSIIDANPAALEILGFSKDELEDISMHGSSTSLLSPNGTIIPLSEHPVAKAFSSGHPQTAVLGTFNKLRREYRWIDIAVTPVFLEGSSLPDHVYGIFTDVTERKAAEDALRESEFRHRTLYEKMKQGVLYFSASGEVESINPAAEEILGLSLAQLRGTEPRDERFHIISEDGVRYAPGFHPSRIALGSGKAAELTLGIFNCRKNEYRWIDLSVTPQFRPGETAPFRVYSTFTDITERKQILEDLMVAKQKAEEMNKVKSYFFANMSHELRTPFVGILGFAEVLATTAATEEDKELIAGIISSSERMIDTLNKILALTKLEFEPPKQHVRNVDVNKVLQSCFHLFQQPAAQKGLHMELMKLAEPLSIHADEKLFSEVIINLVSNAVKYTLQGSVLIEAHFHSVAGAHRLVIRVADTGIGIPPEKQDVIWREFRQVSEGINRNFEGTGLGLSITKKYVELLHGTISVESAPNRGSVFQFTLPLRAAGRGIFETINTASSGSKTGKTDSRHE